MCPQTQLSTNYEIFNQVRKQSGERWVVDPVGCVFLIGPYDDWQTGDNALASPEPALTYYTDCI